MFQWDISYWLRRFIRFCFNIFCWEIKSLSKRLFIYVHKWLCKFTFYGVHSLQAFILLHWLNPVSSTWFILMSNFITKKICYNELAKLRKFGELMSYKTKAVHLIPCRKLNTSSSNAPYLKKCLYSFTFRNRPPLALAWPKNLNPRVASVIPHNQF
jgi:hypothetical protein